MMLDKFLLGLVLSLASAGVFAQDRPPPLPVEPTGVIETLPERYPADWFLVHDAAFFHMSDGKIYVIDTSKDSLGDQVKGLFNNVLMGAILQVPSRGEIMSVETFHTRGTRGDRIDVLTVWDTVNLSPVAEVVLPTGKRFMGMPERVVLQTLNNDRWLAIFNLSPSTSVSLVDLDAREVIGEIPTPGCSFIYPNKDLAFSAICAEGGFLT